MVQGQEVGTVCKPQVGPRQAAGLWLQSGPEQEFKGDLASHLPAFQLQSPLHIHKAEPKRSAKPNGRHWLQLLTFGNEDVFSLVRCKILDIIFFVQFYLYSLIWTTWEFSWLVFSKTSKAYALIPVVEVLIATIAPLSWRVRPIAHQSPAITTTWDPTTIFQEVVPERKRYK